MADTASATAHSASSAIWNASMPLGFKVAFRFDRGHTTRARRRDGLAIRAILNVPRVEHARNIGAGSSVRNDVAVRIQVDLTLERLGVGNMTDGHEEAADTVSYTHLTLPT